jgi:methionine synthase I (cobalamin-dependent)
MLLSQRLAEVPVLLADGATATNFFEMGLIPGQAPETWLEQHPDRVAALHQRFVDAGADIILTNSFGGTSRRLRLCHAAARVRSINTRAAELARTVADTAGRPVIVAGSVGPTGDQFAPGGPLTDSQAVDIFSEQIEALKAGGVDVIWIETMSAVAEMRAATIAVLTASFHDDGRAMLRVTPQNFASFAEMLVPRPVAIGSNCGVGVSDLVLSILHMSLSGTAIPLVAKGNAGNPVINGQRLRYAATLELMADYVSLAARAGARIVGGCCGTSPAHVLVMRRALDSLRSGIRPDLAEIVARLGPLQWPAPHGRPTCRNAP